MYFVCSSRALVFTVLKTYFFSRNLPNQLDTSFSTCFPMLCYSFLCSAEALALAFRWFDQGDVPSAGPHATQSKSLWSVLESTGSEVRKLRSLWVQEDVAWLDVPMIKRFLRQEAKALCHIQGHLATSCRWERALRALSSSLSFQITMKIFWAFLELVNEELLSEMLRPAKETHHVAIPTWCERQ